MLLDFTDLDVGWYWLVFVLLVSVFCGCGFWRLFLVFICLIACVCLLLYVCLLC